MALLSALPFHAELKQPISSHPYFELTRVSGFLFCLVCLLVCLFVLIAQAPALFALLICITEVFTFLGNLFSVQQELPGIPRGGDASQDKDQSVCRYFPE